MHHRAYFGKRSIGDLESPTDNSVNIEKKDFKINSLDSILSGCNSIGKMLSTCQVAAILDFKMVPVSHKAHYDTKESK